MISQSATVPSGSHSMPMHPQSSHMHHQGPPQQHPNQAVHHQAYTSAPGSSHYQVRTEFSSFIFRTLIKFDISSSLYDVFLSEISSFSNACEWSGVK